jgi:hypothetical protein
MSTPQFWSTPLRYIRWASYEKPAILYSLIIGSMGPVALFGIPPIRRALGDVDPEPIPLTYPSMNHLLPSAWCISIRNTYETFETNQHLRYTVPQGKRVIPQGYDDE